MLTNVKERDGHVNWLLVKNPIMLKPQKTHDSDVAKDRNKLYI